MSIGDKELVISICPIIVELPLAQSCAIWRFSLNNLADQLPIFAVIAAEKFGLAEELLWYIGPGKCRQRTDSLLISLTEVNRYSGRITNVVKCYMPVGVQIFVEKFGRSLAFFIPG